MCQFRWKHANPQGINRNGESISMDINLHFMTAPRMFCFIIGFLKESPWKGLSATGRDSVLKCISQGPDALNVWDGVREERGRAGQPLEFTPSFTGRRSSPGLLLSDGQKAAERREKDRPQLVIRLW